MSRGTVLDERSKKALQQAIDEGMETMEQMAERMRIELSDSEDEDDSPHWSEQPPESDEPTTTTVARYTWRFGFKVLAVVDYVGEWLGKELGITTPKYQYVIDELISIQDEIKREEAEEAAALAEAHEIEDARLQEMEEDRSGDDVPSGDSHIRDDGQPEENAHAIDADLDIADALPPPRESDV